MLRPAPMFAPGATNTRTGGSSLSRGQLIKRAVRRPAVDHHDLVRQLGLLGYCIQELGESPAVITHGHDQ